MTPRDRLIATLAGAGVPVDRVSNSHPFTVTYQAWATDAQRATGDAMLAAFDPDEQLPEPFPVLFPSQLRRKLRRVGITPEMVKSAIAAIPDPLTRGDAQDLWEYSTTFHRENPLIGMLGSEMGLTVEQIDSLWRDAGEIQ